MSRTKHVIFNYAKRSRPSRKRLYIIIAAVGLVILLVAAVVVYEKIKSKPAPAPVVATVIKKTTPKILPQGVTSSQLDQQEETFTSQLATDEAKLDGLVQ